MSGLHRGVYVRRTGEIGKFNGYDLVRWESRLGRGPGYVIYDGRLDADPFVVWESETATEAEAVRMFERIVRGKP